MRTGPKPLPFQLAMASIASTGLAGGEKFSQETLQQFFAGIKKYQEYPTLPQSRTRPVVWQKNSVRLFFCERLNKIARGNILLVPSMINGSSILDLCEERTLQGFLSSFGWNTYLLDWGRGQTDGPITVDEAVHDYMKEAIDHIGSEVILLGYCMGGLLAAAASYLYSDRIRGVILLATPWNFHDKTGALRGRIALLQPSATLYAKNHGRLPEGWVQGMFATLDPENTVKKFAAFAGMEDDHAQSEMFVAVEDWLNDGGDLPAGIAETCMRDWYGENKPYEGEWSVCGQKIRAENIQARTLVIGAAKDKIVPLDSAQAFAQQRIKCDQIIYDGGHISLIAGKNAVKDVWHPLAEWCADLSA